MPNELTWTEIVLRLFLTVAAGTIIGINRGEHGRPAGLRTTLLVCLAAAISMIQVNQLLPMAGKAHDSYVVMDLMRLPLGILTGVGFIGAGAILRRDNVVLGVTTAATLWFVTVMGLCFGGGQIRLGLAAFALGFVVLSLLRSVESWCPQDHEATLTATLGAGAPSMQEIIALIETADYKVKSVSVTYESSVSIREVKYRVKWRSLRGPEETPEFVTELAQRAGTVRVAWAV